MHDHYWLAARAEADPREAAAVRPWMTDEERAELYAALDAESDAADLLVGTPEVDW